MDRRVVQPGAAEAASPGSVYPLPRRGGGAAVPEPAAGTEGRVLARNSILNLLGWGIPMGVALLAMPLLIRGLGEERFGILTVGWVVLGYFGLFDFGIGRALTKMVAERLGARRMESVAPLVWTALLLMFLLGVVGALALSAVAPWLVGSALKISPVYQAEALQVFYLLAFSLPWVITTTGLSGVLEANQSFGLVSALRAPLGVLSYLGPLAVLPFSSSLVPVIGFLVVARVFAWGAYLAACLRVLPVLRKIVAPDRAEVRALARLGGWMTVSNVVSPLMTYFDRFLIGGLISMAVVGYYVTPYELVTKLLLVPNALLGVLFPAFAATFVSDRARTALLLDRGVRGIFLVIFPLTLVVMTLAHEGMSLWLGEEFAGHSAGVLRWLALGVFINCLGQAPFALLQGIGRPDVTAKLHLLEFPGYVAVIWTLAQGFGLEGVAMAWVLRVTVDTTVLYVLARRFLPESPGLVRGVGRLVLPALAVLGLAFIHEGIQEKLVFLLVVMAVFAPLAWFRILAPAERAHLQARRPLLGT